MKIGKQEAIILIFLGLLVLSFGITLCFLSSSKEFPIFILIVGVIFIIIGIIASLNCKDEEETDNNAKNSSETTTNSSEKTATSSENIINNAGLTKTDILEIFRHFKKMYEKFGVRLSNEKLSHIIAQFAMKNSVEEQSVYLMSYIPKNPPSVDFFCEETLTHINNIINRFVPKILVPMLKQYFSYSQFFFSQEEMLELIEGQKNAYPFSIFDDYRYNYELSACIFVLNQLDDVSPLFIQEAQFAKGKIVEYIEQEEGLILNS